ncbi:MAG: DUF58 domain-containing protein [Streptosporangiaceae bacterium]
MALSARAAILALLGVIAVLIVPAAGLSVLGVEAVIVAAILADLVLAASPRGLRLRRNGDTLVRLGETAAVHLIVENPSGRRVSGRLRDAWPPSAGGRPRDARVDIPAGERRRLTTTLTPTRRGDRAATVVTLRCFGPLGLAARQASHRVPWTVRVLPAFESRRHLPTKLARLRELDGRQAARVRGQGTEFDSLREYVDGDDVRSIDWRATARRDSVVVRTWRPERDRRIIIVLDTGRTSAGRVGDVTRLDCAMDAALLLATVASRAGDRVDMLAFDRRLRASVEGTSRTRVLPALVQAMASLEPELVESDASAMISAILRRTRRRALVVLLTDLNAPAIDEGLLPRLGALVGRHLVLVAGVADPRVAEMRAGRGTIEAAYDAAAAERAAGHRRGVTASLRRHGVEVVDATPQEIAPAVVDAYLDLKAAGRL